MWWASFSSRATVWSLSPTLSGTFLWRQERVFTITPSGGTCTYQSRCCTPQGDKWPSARDGVSGRARKVRSKMQYPGKVPLDLSGRNYDYNVYFLITKH